MVVYVLSKADLSIKDIINPISHSNCEDSVVTVKSELRVPEAPNASSGDYVVLNEKGSVMFAGIVDTVLSEKGTSVHTIYILSLLSLFDREIVLDGETMTGTTGIEDFIVYTIQNQFKSSGDTLMDIAYLEPVALTHTVEAIVPENDNGIWNMAQFIRYVAKRYGIMTAFEISSDRRLLMSIQKAGPTTRNIDATLADVSSYNETMDADTVSKVFVKTGSGNVYSYYLFDNGVYDTDQAAGNRVQGRATAVYVDNDGMQKKRQGMCLVPIDTTTVSSLRF